MNARILYNAEGHSQFIVFGEYESLLSRNAALEAERDALVALVDKHGICTDCGELYSHDITAPFASCDCKHSEWNESKMTPYMVLEKRCFKLRKLVEKARELYIEEHSDGETDCVTPFDIHGE